MTPVKIDLIQQILQKTALPREQNPKIYIERIKFYDKYVSKPGQTGSNDLDSDNEGENVQNTQKLKDNFMFLKAYD